MPPAIRSVPLEAVYIAVLVFDLRLSCRGTSTLFEVKAIQYSLASGGSWYRSRELTAVNQRALRVLPERFRDARRVDTLLFPFHPQGPILHRLHALGGVEPLVVGAFAERNQRAHRLVADLAQAAASRVRRESAVDAQSARGLAVWHLKRFLCCSAWRGLAQLQRERAHRFLLADVQAQGGHRDNNGLELHQANRLEAIASAINHVTGRSSFVPRRGGR